MAEDDSRKAILARRAFFITAAIASAGIGSAVVPACGGETEESRADAAPQPCLEYAPDSGTNADATPRPCLEVAVDASVDVDSVEVDSGDLQDAEAEADDAGPRPCLTPY